MFKKVIIIDDNMTIRRLFSRFFEQLGAEEILTAEDGIIGLSMIRKNPDIDLIATDWNMPNMDGKDMCEEVRKIDAFKDTKILIITAQDEADIALDAVTIDAAGVIRKPTTMGALKKKLSEMK